jgi:hypothetical protein
VRVASVITIISLLSRFQAEAQYAARPEIDIQSFIESLFQVPDADVNYDDLYETLYQLYSNPINLNNTSKNELNSLYQLNINQINNLINYIEDHGPLLSIYELQIIPGFDSATIESILPFVEVRSAGDQSTRGNILERIWNEENNYLLIRSERIIQKQEGYKRTDSTKYLGSPHKIYARFRVNHTKDFSAGFTIEKDAGERVVWDQAHQQYGFDYYSFHLFLEEKGNLKKIALGDYQMQFGQGLVIGSGFNPGKGAETITTVKRGNSGIRAYTSALETSFMRGIGFTYRINSFDITPFYSRLKQDGVIRSGDQAGEYEEYISSIQDIGMHRTYSELASKKRIQEQSFGVNVTFNDLKSKNLQAGITYIHNQFSVPIAKTPNNYNQFEFKGNQNDNLGLFANYNWHNLLLFMEGAASKSGGTAFVGGFMGSLSPIISMSLSYRNYSKEYHSFYGNSFGEGARNINETGIYWGIKIEPSRKISLSAYYDRFKFPWLKFGVNAPSQGFEFLIRANYNFNRSIKAYVQFREESKQETLSIPDSNTQTLAEGIKRSYAANLNLTANKMITLKSRVQLSTYDQLGIQTKGMAVIQDFNIKWNKWKISARVALFDSEDYENRQYVYEKDLLYVFSIPAYAGQGTRSYLMLQYKASRKLVFWLRYGSYKYRNVDTIGSGLNQIKGSTKSDLKFQIRYKF